MAVRVKVLLVRNGRFVETVALANSGYEAETPQVLIPVEVARILELWPPSRDMFESDFETAGGLLRVWIAPSACRIKVISRDVESREVVVDVVVSTIADEVLLNDKLISELGLALEDVGRGLWRFMWEPKENLRRSEPPKRWR